MVQRENFDFVGRSERQSLVHYWVHPPRHSLPPIRTRGMVISRHPCKEPVLFKILSDVEKKKKKKKKKK
jgi:hypothetical protein